MTRRITLVGGGLVLTLALTAVLTVASWAVQAAAPPAIGSNSGVKLDLKGQLQKGLKARRPVEFSYINEVITLVEAGTLPRSLVDSSFLKARKQPRRQLQYFQFTLKSQADKLGIATPSLDGQFVEPF